MTVSASLTRASRLLYPMTNAGRLLTVAEDQLATLEAEFERFESAWQSGSPPDIEQFLSDVSSRQELSDVLRRQRFLAELVAIDLERRWRSTACSPKTTVASSSHEHPLPDKPRLEDYLQRFPALAGTGQLPIDLVGQEYRARVLWGDAPSLSEYVSRFPRHADAVRGELARIDHEISVAGLSRGRSADASDCVLARHVAATVDSHKAPAVGVEPPPLPKRIGRFEVIDVLGSGGFGVVYRARDPQLDREVAIKVPRADCVASLGGTDAYLAEARTIASLDHPGIVPVYEAGVTDDGLCYAVTKLMSGGNLAQLIATRRPSFERSAQLVARIADALHHAHQHGLVHRDIKPANILLDADGRPLVVDFGLALHEDDFGSGPAFVGTLAYMSPEQASDAGHMVDARSDIFSLGLVLFELLSGKSPYRGKSKQKLVEEITTCDPRPIRQLDSVVPPDLDRICQKARATRPADRYATAQDFANDLRAFLRERVKQSKPRWLLPAALAAVAALAMLAIGLTLKFDGGAPTVSEMAVVPLDAPFIDIDHTVIEDDAKRWMEVTPMSMPLPQEDEVALDVDLPKGQAGYVYLFQFDEGKSPELLWPADLSKQSPTTGVRYPGAGAAMPLSGDPRRIMFVAAVSPTPLGTEELKKIEAVAFSFDEVSAEKPMCKLFYPAAPKDAEERNAACRVVQIDPVRLSTNPGNELRQHFDAFSAVVVSYQSTEPK